MTPAEEPPRFERKFASESLGGAELEQLLRLHPDLFRAAYPPRSVNTLYLDTPCRAHYRANEDGDARRRKVRLRWYGGLFGEVDAPRLELKERSGHAVLKRVLPGARFRAEPATLPDAALRALAGSELPPEIVELLKGLEPVVLVRYRRSYWLSEGSGLRATVDTGLEYRDASRTHRLDRPCADPLAAILELKYPVARDVQARHALRGLPLRATRSSKYVRGLQAVRDGVPAPL